MSDEEKRLREMIDELFDVDEGLTSWEIDFLDSVNDWEGMFTERQAETIERMWNKVLG